MKKYIITFDLSTLKLRDKYLMDEIYIVKEYVIKYKKSQLILTFKAPKEMCNLIAVRATDMGAISTELI